MDLYIWIYMAPCTENVENAVDAVILCRYCCRTVPLPLKAWSCRMRGAALSQPYFWYDSICWSYADFATPYITARKKASNCWKKWTTVYNYYRFQLSHSMTEVLVQYHESQIPATIQLMHSPSLRMTAVLMSRHLGLSRTECKDISVSKISIGLRRSALDVTALKLRKNPALQGTYQWTNGYGFWGPFSLAFFATAHLWSLWSQESIRCFAVGQARPSMEAIWLGLYSTVPQSIDSWSAQNLLRASRAHWRVTPSQESWDWAAPNQMGLWVIIIDRWSFLPPWSP